jgi:hypothetical protein
MAETLLNSPDRAKAYDEIMRLAMKQLPEQPGAALGGPAGFFFPWEYSPYRANGSTSAESGGNGNQKSE